MTDINKLKLAIDFTQNGDYDKAEKVYSELLEKNPDDSVLLSAVGLFYVNQKNFEKAVIYLKKACDIKETFGTVASLGLAYYEQQNFYNAYKVLEHSLDFGENVDIYNKLILSLFELKNYTKVSSYIEKMSELYPKDSRTIANQVRILTHTGNLIEAEKICVNFLKEHPEDSSLWYHLGLLKELIYSNDKQAIECYKIAKENGNISADYNIAVAYQKLGEFEEAEKYYKSFLEIFPENNKGISSLSLCYLTQRIFDKGYELYYKRNKARVENLWKPHTPLNKELVIIGDQGFGDQIQFIRYIPFLKEHNIKIAVSKELKRLFEYNYPGFKFIDYSEIDYSVQALRLTDLPYVLNMDFDNIPYTEDYLNAEKENIESDKIKVGLCWEADASGIRGMINRTINIKLLEPIINLEKFQIYSFQYKDSFDGCKKYPQIINLAKNFNDFYDTAKALKAMDVVITVDTAVAHLAGALGIKTCLLLPYTADWRWFRSIKKCYQNTKENDDTTLWYDSVKIFMQNEPISWEKPINDIINRLLT